MLRRSRVLESLVRLALSVALVLGCALPLHAETAAPASADTGRSESPFAVQPPPRPRQPAVDPEVERLNATVGQLRDDMRHLQNDAERLETANERLTELNAQLRQEVESLALELQAARASASRRWLLYGAGLLLLGVLTGVIIKARPRRSAWS